MTPVPRILVIAGSDSGGGAGIQADIKTVTMLGGHAMTAVTAITAQNTVGVTSVHPVPAEMIPSMRVHFRRALAALVPSDWAGVPQETTSVPAGRFEGCYRGRTEAQWGTWRSLAESWRHPAVPLSGLVRSQGIDRHFTMSLIAFGTSGAIADF